MEGEEEKEEVGLYSGNNNNNNNHYSVYSTCPVWSRSCVRGLFTFFRRLIDLSEVWIGVYSTIQDLLE